MHDVMQLTSFFFGTQIASIDYKCDIDCPVRFIRIFADLVCLRLALMSALLFCHRLILVRYCFVIG